MFCADAVPLRPPNTHPGSLTDISLDVIKATGDASEFPTRVPLRCLCRSSACRYSQYLQARTALHQSLNLPAIIITGVTARVNSKKSPYFLSKGWWQLHLLISATNHHYILGFLPHRPPSLPIREIREIRVIRDSDNPSLFPPSILPPFFCVFPKSLTLDTFGLT